MGSSFKHTVNLNLGCLSKLKKEKEKGCLSKLKKEEEKDINIYDF